jgi:cyclohexa-1,5-dienecarbonyl-CoA hydratase
MPYQLIKVQEKNAGAVTEIILSNAPGNIVSAQMMREIAAQMKIDEDNPHKKLILLSAEGKHFSFGASVQEHGADQIRQMLPYFHSFIGGIINCKVPTMAKVSGLCLGGAFELVLASTFIVADESAKFGVPEIVLGVFPPPACILLPARCGDVLAVQMVLCGEPVDARKLYERGLITILAEKGKLDTVVEEFIEKQLLPKSASSIRFAHRAVRCNLSDLYAKHIAKLENLYIQDLMATTDAPEGIQAFLEKRPPRWLDS